MKLREWREKEGLSQEELAAKLKTTQESVSYWEKDSIPKRATMKLIIRLTKGKVTANDFI